MRMEEVESSHQLGATVDASTRVSLLVSGAVQQMLECVSSCLVCVDEKCSQLSCRLCSSVFLNWSHLLLGAPETTWS